MEETTIRGVCPQCGRQLEIPAELEVFSCMFCGCRINRTQFLAPLQGDPEADLAFVREHIVDTVRGHRELKKSIRRELFEEASDAYLAEIRETFERLEQLWVLRPDDREPLIDRLCTLLLDGLASGWDSKKDRFAQDDDKVVIAIFLSPAVRRLATESGEAFVVALNQEWTRRYPGSPYFLGTFDELKNGFRKKAFGLCYITTAVCRQEGKPDDCAELTAFRAFRDGYLRSCPDGEALIAEYYALAPAIVTMLETCTDPDESFRTIRTRWLDGCYEDIRAGRMAECKARYTDMVRTLEHRFLS